tara:strand:+ start:431 stop:832 length:402 start_codon:yes stop_codon:yes gene_type:complete
MKKDDLHLLQEAYGSINEINIGHDDDDMSDEELEKWNAEENEREKGWIDPNFFDDKKEPARDPDEGVINLHRYVTLHFLDELRDTLKEMKDDDDSSAIEISQQLKDNWTDTVRNACNEVIEELTGDPPWDPAE